VAISIRSPSGAGTEISGTEVEGVEEELEELGVEGISGTITEDRYSGVTG
jgi:hypothetical protein